MTDVGHVWAREQESGKGQHYHCALIMDGKLVKSPHRVLKYIEAIAEGWGWPKPFTPERCFYDIRHGDTGELERAFYRLSYLAKTKGKHCGAKLSNNYSTSQLKPKRTITTNQKHLAMAGERSPKQKVLSEGVAPAGHTYTQKCTCASEQEPGAVIRMSG